MRNGQCPKCGGSEVYSAQKGMTFGTSGGVYAHGFPKAMKWDSYVCITCGYFESYITDDRLGQIPKYWSRVAKST